MPDPRAQLGGMVIFARVAGYGSFAAAARSLGVSRSVVSEALAALERDVGVRLLERSTRKLRLTQAGEALLPRCAQIDAEAVAALREIELLGKRPTGTLRVTCPSVIASELVAPVLAQLRRDCGLSSHLGVSDFRADLLGEGIDVAVRVGVPSEASAVIRQLGRVEEWVVAAPGLLAPRERDRLDAVAAAPWISHAALPRDFTVRDPRGKRHVVRVEPACTTTTAEGQRALALHGAGATVAMAPLVTADVAAGRLVRLLSGYALPDVSLFAQLPSARGLAVRTRLFLNAMVAATAK
ncbi:MAG: LysR family transcriptional regulator [Kofleriaceae bacterium]